MSRPSLLVVVGASIGGLTVAETARQEGLDGGILLVGDEPHLPYTRPPLSKQVLMGDWEPDQAAIRTASEIDDLDIELRTDCRATGLDVSGRVLHTSTGDVAYDELVIATGCTPRRHPELPSAPSLRTLSEALSLRDSLRTAGSVAVVGSGILGSEIASAARKHGAETVLVGRSGTLGFGGVGTLLTERLTDLHLAHDVELLLRAEVVGSNVAGDATTITFGDGSARRFDLVVAMIGGTPSTAWLEASSLPLGDGILCDGTGLAAPGVHAVGDVAAWADPVTGAHVRVEHQSSSIEQAINVATRIVHGTVAEPPAPLFWSEIHGARIHAYGWFDPARPLVDTTPPESAGAVLASTDVDEQVRGVVGWNAAPRDFRAARATVTTLPARPAVLRQGAPR